MRVEMLGKRCRFGSKGVPVVAAVSVKLKMRHVSTMPIQNLHGFDRGGDISGSSEVVAMDMQGMRQVQFIDNLRETADDLSSGYFGIAFNGIGKRFRVFAPFPGGDSAGINSLYSIGFCRA